MSTETEQRMAELLDEVEAPPCRADIARAVTTGRRRRRQRRFAAVAAVVLAVAAGSLVSVRVARQLPPPADGPVPVAACRASELPLPPGADSRPGGELVAVDPTGTYLLGNVSIGGVLRAVRYRNGVGEILPPEARGATAIGADGTVVGRPDDGSGWVYHDGRVTPLGIPAGFRWVGPSVVTARGDIVGDAYSSDDRIQPVLWTAADPGRATVVPNPDPVRVLGVARDGSFVATGGPNMRIHVWQSGRPPRVLPQPASGDDAEARAVGGRWVAGRVLDPDIGYAPVRWPIDGGEPTVFRTDGTAVDVDLTGRLLLGDDAAMVIGQDGVARDLPAPEGRGYDDLVTLIAVQMSDDGATIVGVAQVGGGLRQILWRC